ncbi:MAG TPA: GatB/YqeY domain-containing protein [Polyangiaceae bacterium]
MLIDEIKARMFRAMKAGNTIEKEILRVAMGEITTDAAREGRKGDDEEASAILRKLIKSNQESLAEVQDLQRRSDLEQEIEVLTTLLPPSLGPEEIAEALQPVREEIRSAKSDGQATGIAMKHLKTAKAAVDGKAVAAAVQRIRAS